MSYAHAPSSLSACCSGCAAGASTCDSLGADAAPMDATSLAVQSATTAGIYYALGQRYPKMHWYQQLVIGAACGVVAGRLVRGIK